MKIVIAALHHPERYRKQLEKFNKDEYRFYEHMEPPLKDAKDRALSDVQNLLVRGLNDFDKNVVTEVIILTDYNLGFSGTLLSSIPRLNEFINSFQDRHGQQLKAQNKCTMNLNSSPAASAAAPVFIPVTFYFDGSLLAKTESLEVAQYTLPEINELYGKAGQTFIQFLASMRPSSRTGTPNRSSTPSSASGRLKPSASPPIPSAISFNTDPKSSATPPIPNYEGSVRTPSHPSLLSASASPLSGVASGNNSVSSLSFFSVLSPRDVNNPYFNYPKMESQLLERSKSTLPHVDEELTVINQSISDESQKDGLGEDTILAFSRMLQISDKAATLSPAIVKTNQSDDLGAEQERASPPPSLLHRLMAKPVPTRPALSVEVNDSSSISSRSS